MGLLSQSERDRLAGLLEQLPNIAFNWNAIRAQLLSGLPPGVVLNIPAIGIPRPDIGSLLDTIEGPGMQLAGGAWAVAQVIDNAAQLAGGLALERELRELHVLGVARRDARAVEGLELEALINQRSGFQGVAQWARRLFEVIRPVCRVDVDGNPNGTGFLVGPSLVLTNHHVTHLPDGATPIPAARLSARFDFHPREDGTPARGVSFAVRDEALPRSPFGELDFALLRLEGDPGERPVADLAANPPRGWLTPRDLPLVAGDPLFVIQHPQGRPMEVAFDLVTGLDPLARRVRYRANSERGSSGAPCFDKGWELVALHHAGDAGANQGIPLGYILALPEVRALLPA